jgi:pilus assembly protein CpaC
MIRQYVPTRRNMVNRAIISIFALAILPMLTLVEISAGMAATTGSNQDKILRVDRVGPNQRLKRIKLGLNKSLIIRLPRDARDVLVSNPKKVDAVVRSANLTYLIGLEVGQTNVFFFDEKGREMLILEVEVERDLTTLRRMISRLLPDTSIKIEAINDNVILSGIARSSAEANRAKQLAEKFAGDEKKVLNLIQISGKEQVMLKVTIAEMQRDVLKQLGVDLTAALRIGSSVINFASINPFSVAGSALNGSGLSSAYTSGGGDNSVNSVLRAMERVGVLRTLAEPTLTAITGESAKFLAGGEFPVPTGQDRDGNITIEFKPFGVGLGFTPLVLSEGRISMKVSTEVSELSNQGAVTLGTISIPALKVRRAETTVELPSGGSLVMAGLIQESLKQTINGFPGIKDLPILGSLFRSRDFQNSETELVVIVTPYIVKPVARNKLVRPDKGFEIASDVETIFMGQLHKVYGVKGRPLPRGAYRGGVGFIIE